ncbi:RagB/SusD family nutrient uptake outer membrane protein [Bacteroides fragilis]|nr:RagB/SusD family nutrient uptake outer membrane protein [Bacteroides fragilis]
MKLLKAHSYFRWDPDLINKDGNESWTDIFIVKWSLSILMILRPLKKIIPVIRYAEVLLTYAEA